MQKTDIGFVVIKPLPKTIFGRTCLKTYDVDQGRRHYITRNYDINFPTEERFIPNEGLGIDQMVHSIYSVGLEPYIAQFRGIADVKNETYALLKGGIPMILGLALVNTSKANDKRGSDVMTHFDNHAVAVSGYSLGRGYQGVFQNFSPHRTGSWEDVGFNALGCLAGVLVWKLVSGLPFRA